MKWIFTKKKLQGEIDKVVEPLNEKIEELSKIITDKEFKYLDKVSVLEKEKELLLKTNQSHQEMIESREKEIEELNIEINKLKQKSKEYSGAKGGLIKQINKLQERLTEAEIKLSQRYIIKELKPEKARNTQIMKTKSSSKTSQIIKKVVEDE